MKGPTGNQIDKWKEFRPRHITRKGLEVCVGRGRWSMSSTNMFVIRKSLKCHCSIRANFEYSCAQLVQGYLLSTDYKQVAVLGISKQNGE